MDMVKVAVFPGQGSQTVGMGKALYDEVPEARMVFETVDEALSQKLSRLIFEGPADEMTLTANTQPALMAMSMATVRALEARSGCPISDMVSHVAGHSLGEYSALAAVGALDLSDAARLLRIRGSAMQDAVPVGQGAMAAILGLAIVDVEAVALEASTGSDVCDVANDNSDGQVVLSGSAGAVERACALAKERGARRAMMLQVSAPFHSRLMQPAADRLAGALAEVPFRKPARPVIANVLATPNDDAGAIADLLERQVTARVRWRESMAWMAANNAGSLIEIGAGKVLTGLAKRAVPGATLVNLSTPADIDSYLETLEGNA
ncbi:MAG: ACP S-malonyltransferase [Geminicoccaceae bacterium]